MRPIAIVVLCLLALSSSGARAQYVNKQPSIVVDGYGEVKTMPDQGSISFTLRGEGTTSDSALKAMVEIGGRVQNALRSIDDDIEPKTGSVRVIQARGTDCKSDQDDEESERLSTGACAVVGFIATQSVAVRTGNVKDAGTLVGLASRSGALNAHIDSFEISNLKDAKSQAIAAAYVDAQAKASAVAAAAGVRLGHILSASTEGRAFAQEAVISGSRRPRANAEMDDIVAVPMSPAPITTSATISIAYEIAR